jgi:23S rRNA pseudouridine1911/1915/1917 synthase
VSGGVDLSEGSWEDHVRKLPSVPKAEIVSADAPGALHALLHYRAISQSQLGSLLQIRPQTGRTHQIRVQAASRGYPVLGDWLYGSKIEFGPQTQNERERAIALHARSLTFRHPTTQVACNVTAEVPERWLSDDRIIVLLNSTG